MVRNVVSALYTKRGSLEQLVRLYGMDYFSSNTPAGTLTERMEESRSGEWLRESMKRASEALAARRETKKETDWNAASRTVQAKKKTSKKTFTKKTFTKK